MLDRLPTLVLEALEPYLPPRTCVKLRSTTSALRTFPLRLLPGDYRPLLDDPADWPRVRTTVMRALAEPWFTVDDLEETAKTAIYVSDLETWTLLIAPIDRASANIVPSSRNWSLAVTMYHQLHRGRSINAHESSASVECPAMVEVAFAQSKELARYVAASKNSLTRVQLTGALAYMSVRCPEVIESWLARPRGFFPPEIVDLIQSSTKLNKELYK
ncbi:hypothetical protein BC828DRAFT_375532 [Blastocladiella britannica]|nr:hypothetical protein BC828DRAFT_375532 [Blastocladiella britannica]